jgi:hypothetical protein
VRKTADPTHKHKRRHGPRSLRTPVKLAPARPLTNTCTRIRRFLWVKGPLTSVRTPKTPSSAGCPASSGAACLTESSNSLSFIQRSDVFFAE